jgi:hypothetical protein
LLEILFSTNFQCKADGHFEFPIPSKYHLLLRSFIGTYVPNFI